MMLVCLLDLNMGTLLYEFVSKLKILCKMKIKYSFYLFLHVHAKFIVCILFLSHPF